MPNDYNKNSSPRITRKLAGHIKWLWKNTRLNQAQIAALLGALNQGRVSEVVNGKRWPDVPPIAFVGDMPNG
jgi:predicted XRE-type DNA-binding protein